MREFIYGAAYVGAAYLVAIPVFFAAWFLRDHFKFNTGDRAELARLMGAYDGKTPVEGATTHRRSRSPFARPRAVAAARLQPAVSVIDLSTTVEETGTGAVPGS